MEINGTHYNFMPDDKKQEIIKKIGDKFKEKTEEEKKLINKKISDKYMEKSEEEKQISEKKKINIKKNQKKKKIKLVKKE